MHFCDARIPKFNKNKYYENRFSFINVDLYYQKGESSWWFSVKATNLLNTASNNNDSFSDQCNSTTAYFVLPRIVMFVARYDIN